MAVISKLDYNAKNITKYNNAIISNINYGGVDYHFAKNTEVIGGYCDNAVEEPIIDLKISGNSVQDVTPTPDAPVEIESVGDRTINIWDEKWEVGAITNQGGNQTSSNSIRSKNYIPVKAGHKYYLTVPQMIRLVMFDENKVYSNHMFPTTSFTPGVDGYVRFSIGEVGATPPITTYNNDICISETEGNYEPYGYKVPVKVSGKNLFNKSSSPVESNSKITIEETETGVKLINPAVSSTNIYRGSIYIIDSVENIGANKIFVNADVNLYKVPKSYIHLLIGDENGNNRTIITELRITTSGNYNTSIAIDAEKYAGKYLFLRLYSIGVDDEIILEEGSYVEYSNLMLSIGESEYEPYINTTTNIYLNEPLRKAGDYADYIDYKNKKVVRRVKKVDLGSLTWKYDASNLYFYSQSLSNREKGAKNMICSHYPVKYQSLTSGDDFIRGSTTNFIIQVKDLDYQDVLDFKYSVAGMILYYEVLTPIEEAITIPEISTSKGTNIFITETTIQPSEFKVNYWKQIGVVEAEEEITQDGSNILIIKTGADITQIGSNLLIGE